MCPEDILFWLKAVPFKPFRICLNSGRTYEIRHPEMLKVSRTTMLVFSFAGEPQDPSRRWKWSALSWSSASSRSRLRLTLEGPRLRS